MGPRYSEIPEGGLVTRYGGCGVWECMGLHVTLLGAREYYAFAPDGCGIYHERTTPQAVGMTRQVR